MEEEEANAEIALMAFSDSEVYTNGWSKSCASLKELESLKIKYDSQRMNSIMSVIVWLIIKED